MHNNHVQRKTFVTIQTNFMQIKQFKNIFSVFILLSISAIACTHEDDVDHTPAWHISQSEKLSIPTAVEIPANHPDGNTRVATYYAEGVQKYKAQQKPGSSPATYEWVFVAPDALLYDITNKKKGTHGAGPFWSVSVADSIFGQHFTPVRSAPAHDALSVDWLLLMPKNGTTPTGIFSNVDYIQRIATVGGKAPSQLPVNSTQTIEVKYTAIYRFTKKN